MEVIEKRVKVLENKTNTLKADALKKKKAHDDRGALLALKQMKNFEKEISKLESQQMFLEQ